jgi:hypothetical protein
MNNDYPILNGIAPSWADIIVRATPEGAPLIEVKDIAAITTSATVEVGEQRGASGGRVIRRTTGSVSYEASLTLYKSGYQTLLRNLALAAEAAGLVRGNQRIIALVHFDIQIQHTPINDVEIYERLIKGCRLLGDSHSSAEGTDAEQVEVSLSPIEIVNVIDGKEIAWL